MSDEGLPPLDAPLAVRLAAAMERGGYNQSSLARALGTNRKHVARWLTGETKTIRSVGHRRNLAQLLDTSAEYWREVPRATLEIQVYLLTQELQLHAQRLDALEKRDGD